MRATVSYFQKMKQENIPITMITAYDATSARLAERAGVKAFLVGDSLGMVVQGHENTLPVTLDEMIYHTKMVVRGTEKAFIVGDMPFMTYNISPEQALENAGRFLQEGGAQSVKMEGGIHIAPTIRRVVNAGIPVLAHIGLTPQSVHRFGGWRVQGKTSDAATQVLDDALAIQDAGAYAVVLELVPAELAVMITERLEIPTIGIGAGVGCSGQIQVMHDILGLFDDFLPKHARRYANLSESVCDAIRAYKDDVEARVFPGDENVTRVEESILNGIYGHVES